MPDQVTGRVCSVSVCVMDDCYKIDVVVVDNCDKQQDFVGFRQELQPVILAAFVKDETTVTIEYEEIDTSSGEEESSIKKILTAQVGCCGSKGG